MMRVGVFALAVALLVGATAQAQVFFNPNVGHTENFDSLGGPPPAFLPWVNNVTLPGWYAADGGGAVTTYYLNNGSSATGGLYSYGTDGDTDRALGSQASNAMGQMYWGVQLINVHPLWVLTSFTATYDVEQWRDASEDPSVHFFEYSLNAISIDDAGATWIPVPFGDLVSISNGNLGALNGNAFSYNVTVTVNGINWIPGNSLWLRWVDPNDPGSDHGMAIDNFSFSAVPEPTTFALVGLGMGAAGWMSRRLRRQKAKPAVAA